MLISQDRMQKALNVAIEISKQFTYSHNRPLAKVVYLTFLSSML